jgi:hypothetical protein
VKAVEWELVHRSTYLQYGEDTRTAEETERLRVPGGWIYRTTDYRDDDGPARFAMVFVPESAEVSA